jgi:hypothetical protein
MEMESFQLMLLFLSEFNINMTLFLRIYQEADYHFVLKGRLVQSVIILDIIGSQRLREYGIVIYTIYYKMRSNALSLKQLRNMFPQLPQSFNPTLSDMRITYDILHSICKIGRKEFIQYFIITYTNTPVAHIFDLPTIFYLLCQYGHLETIQ